MKPSIHEIKPISVPAEWTAARDLKYFITCCGESKDYFAKAIAHVRESYRCLEDTVDRAMTYLGTNHANLAGASLWAKLSRLEISLAQGEPPGCNCDGADTEE